MLFMLRAWNNSYTGRLGVRSYPVGLYWYRKTVLQCGWPSLQARRRRSTAYSPIGMVGGIKRLLRHKVQSSSEWVKDPPPTLINHVTFIGAIKHQRKQQFFIALCLWSLSTKLLYYNNNNHNFSKSTDNIHCTKYEYIIYNMTIWPTLYKQVYQYTLSHLAIWEY